VCGFRLARGDLRAQPNRPRLHALDRQHGVRPRVFGEAGADRRLAHRVDDEQNFLAVVLAYGPAENDDTFVGERIHERRMLIPPDLLTPALREIPRGPAPLLDQVVVGHAASLGVQAEIAAGSGSS
jgi:hypothetical protein